ncbi:MAG: hypothetical protein IT368_02955 [Candidatus Hydrogenedentes bacterium]|nr:hypothetical protein [Candidatus Hydrogenedentota bacterium]
MFKGFVLATAVAGIMALSPLAGAEDRTGDAYPLSTCPVSGKALGSMDEPVVAVIDGQEVRFCCGGCKPMYEQDKAKYQAKVDEQIAKNQEGYYPTDKCVNSGEPLGDSPAAFVGGNRLVKTCCNDCKAAVLKDPAKAFEKLDAAAKEKQEGDYPLQTCVVSGEKLGGMGDPVEVVTANRLVKLCCAGCKKALEKDPAKYLGEVDKARSAATSQAKSAS